MPKYVLLKSNTEIYETSVKFPIVNLFAALVWSIAFQQKLLPNLDGVKSLLMGIVFIIIYYCVCLVPVVSIIPAVASGIIYAVLFWSLANKIDSEIVRLVLKIVILLIDIFIEFCIVVNATLRWLQYKLPGKPRIGVVQEYKK